MLLDILRKARELAASLMSSNRPVEPTPPTSGLGAMQKAIVALVISALQLVEIITGWQSGLTEDWILMVLAILSPILVWFIPNR